MYIDDRCLTCDRQFTINDTVLKVRNLHTSDTSVLTTWGYTCDNNRCYHIAKDTTP